MARTVNKYKLPRTIREAVKRSVRQRDGFGCVICGKAVYDYEHFDPDFADTQSHEVDRIILLCIEHHGLKSRGLISKETITSHLKNPYCKRTGFSFGAFDIGTMHPEIVMGEMTCTDVRCLISIDGDEIFSIAPPLGKGLPFRINAELRGARGEIVLKIINNEWRSETSNWDVNIEGPVITIRNAPRKIDLVLRSEPPKRIVIERMEMVHKFYRIYCKEGGYLEIVSPHGNIFSAYKTSFRGFDTAVALNENGMAIGLMPPLISAWPNAQQPIVPVKPSRNSRCECGSGLRFKHCHGKINL
ncbi:MAG: SEC-C domain-containing protein [Methylorubrum populi]